jgi:addiction module RelE/StbE family toxin
VLSVEWSDEALYDLAEIQGYIEQFSPQAAARLRETIEAAAERLPLMPFAFRPGRVAGTREYVVHPNYILVYQVGAEAIIVLRVLHARRNYPG